MKWKIGTILTAFGLRAVGTIFPPYGRTAEYKANQVLPNLLLAPEKIVELKRRGLISASYYYETLQKQGFDSQRADELYFLSSRLAEIGELLELRVRGEINESEYLERMSWLGVSGEWAKRLLSTKDFYFDPDTIIRAWRLGLFSVGSKSDYFNDLRRQGWSDERIETLKKVTEYFPPPDDLIRFAVREVYTPEIVQKYGQMEDLPPKFVEEAKKMGIMEEQAKNYWAAHWILPSVSMGYEMLHRGLITKEELVTLMRTQDIMPFWREKLMGISFTPYTRVDIRRMYKLGVLNRSQVKEAYKQIGYDDEKAEQMTVFTEKLTEETPEDEKTESDKRKEELKGLTVASILKWYKEEMLTQQVAGDYLKGLGLSDEVINAYLVAKDSEKEEERVANYTKAYQRMYVDGVIDANEAIDLLGKLNLPDSYVRYLLSLWDLDKIAKPAIPTKAELIKFVKKGIIKLEDFVSQMFNLGYNEQFIKWYIEDNELAKSQ